LSPDGTRVLVEGDSAVYSWETGLSTPDDTHLPAQTEPIEGLSISSDGARVITQTKHAIQIWSRDKLSEPLWTLTLPKEPDTDEVPRFTPNGHHVGVVTAETILWLDARTGHQSLEIPRRGGERVLRLYPKAGCSDRCRMTTRCFPSTLVPMAVCSRPLNDIQSRFFVQAMAVLRPRR